MRQIVRRLVRRRAVFVDNRLRVHNDRPVFKPCRIGYNGSNRVYRVRQAESRRQPWYIGLVFCSNHRVPCRRKRLSERAIRGLEFQLFNLDPEITPKPVESSVNTARLNRLFTFGSVVSGGQNRRLREISTAFSIPHVHTNKKSDGKKSGCEQSGCEQSGCEQNGKDNQTVRDPVRSLAPLPGNG